MKYVLVIMYWEITLCPPPSPSFQGMLLALLFEYVPYTNNLMALEYCFISFLYQCQNVSSAKFVLNTTL